MRGALDAPVVEIRAVMVPAAPSRIPPSLLRRAIGALNRKDDMDQKKADDVGEKVIAVGKAIMALGLIAVCVGVLVLLYGCDEHSEFHTHNPAAPDTTVVIEPEHCDTLWVTTIIYCHWHRTKNGNPWKHCKEYCDGYKERDDDDDN